jgi:hypothetical protein
MYQLATSGDNRTRAVLYEHVSCSRTNAGSPLSRGMTRVGFGRRDAVVASRRRLSVWVRMRAEPRGWSGQARPRRKLTWKSATKATPNNKCINSRLAATIEHGPCFTNMSCSRTRASRIPRRYKACFAPLSAASRLMSSLHRVPRLDPRFRGDDTCWLGPSRCSSCFEAPPNSFVSFQKGSDEAQPRGAA